MTDAEVPPRLTQLTFHGPLSEARPAGPRLAWRGYYGLLGQAYLTLIPAG